MAHPFAVKMAFLVAFVLETAFFGALPIITLKRCSQKSQDTFLGISNTFAGGIFLASGFIHLLGESTTEIAEFIDVTYPLGTLFCAIGFLIPFFFEKVFFAGYSDHSHGSKKDHKKKKDKAQDPFRQYDSLAQTDVAIRISDKDPLLSSSPDDQQQDSHRKTSSTDSSSDTTLAPLSTTTSTTATTTSSSSSASNTNPDDLNYKPPKQHHHHTHSPWTAQLFIIILSVHSILSGLAMGVQDSVSSIWPIGVAICAHKWIECFSVSVSLLRIDTPIKKTVISLVVYGLMEPLGVIIGLILDTFLSDSASNVMQAIVSSIASGTFIYVAAIDILVEEFEKTSKQKFLKSASCILGFGLMASLALLEFQSSE